MTAGKGHSADEVKNARHVGLAAESVSSDSHNALYVPGIPKNAEPLANACSPPRDQRQKPGGRDERLIWVGTLGIEPRVQTAHGLGEHVNRYEPVARILALLMPLRHLARGERQRLVLDQ